MARIKKRGLDYFPMNTDFWQNRSVRRLLKREGDAAMAALLGAMSIIYADEGYYVRVDDEFCEDLADDLYSLEADDVRRVLRTAVEVGLFDERLFEEYGILTSAEIQRQFVFSKRTRNRPVLDERFNLLPVEEKPADSSAEAPEGEGKMQEKRTEGTQNVQKCPENAEITYQSTQSTAQHSTAQQSKENLLPNGSPQTGGTPSAAPAAAEEDFSGEDKGTGSKAREWTHDELARLAPPPDGLRRNLEGLRLTLDQFRITPREQYAIICLSNYGLIGHPVWQGFVHLRAGRGKIREPGRYLISLCNPKKTAAPGG